MNTVYWVYPARDVEPQRREVDWPREPSFKQLDRLLKPLFQNRDWEHVTVLYEGRRGDMFVDERGAIDDFPRNERATVIYRTNWLTQHPEADPESIPAIYGLAVLFERIVWT